MTAEPQAQLPGGGRHDDQTDPPECSLCEGLGEVAKNFGAYGAGRPEIVPCPDCERRRVNARLDGCDHNLISDIAGGWACKRCGQAFIPLFTEPVRPRRNSAHSRLSGFQEW